tara:strand:- start:1315 stop:1482 length:168 start_codon:yes stop_codon:yes gene_type:complete
MTETNIEKLKKKHRKLDLEIQELVQSEPYNEDLIKKMKNQKLLLKNQILKIENQK